MPILRCTLNAEVIKENSLVITEVVESRVESGWKQRGQQRLLVTLEISAVTVAVPYSTAVLRVLELDNIGT